jgi:glyoxylase-like metal-dependent hydrolase (beta-lactamase superfamily II)
VALVEAERFRLDGGAMFGVVPRALWEKQHPPDARHRIRMATRCLIARGEGRVVVVDTGMGSDWSDKERDIYGVEDQDRSLARGLAEMGVSSDQVTDVILTHLHFDHIGGTVRRTGAELAPVFPNARHHVQQDQIAWAMNPSERDRRSYRPETIEALRRAGVLVPVSGPAEIAPGITVEPTQGHTPGHQVVRLGEGRDAVTYCGDLLPTAAHVPAPWVMAYDLQPLVTMKEKMALMERAARTGETLVVEHDPGCEGVRVARDGGGFVVVERLGPSGPGTKGMA